MHLTIAFIVSLLVSAAGLALEIAGARLVAPVLGSSIDVWTALITVVLAGFAVGHAVGGRVADMPPARSSRICAGSLAVAGLLTFCAPTLMAAFLTSPPFGTIGNALLVSTALFLVPSVLVSVPSAAILKSVLTGTSRDGSRIGVVYAAGSFGAIGGSLLAGYVLVPLVGVAKTLGLAAAACFLSALCMPLILGRRTGRTSVLVCLSAIVASLTMKGEFCDLETAYYCVRTVDVAEGATTPPGRYLVLDTTVHSAIGADEGDFPLAYMKSVRDVLDRNFAPDAAMEGLFLGGGGYALPAWFARTRPASRIGVSEIDPRLPEFVETRLGVDLDRLDLTDSDARIAVRAAAPNSLALVLLDVFSDRSIPSHLVTREFFAEVRNGMTPDGILVANVIDAVERPRLVASVAETMRTSFGHVLMHRVEGSLGKGSANWIVVASDRSVNAGAGFEGPSDMCADCGPVLLTDDRAPVVFLAGTRNGS